MTVRESLEKNHSNNNEEQLFLDILKAIKSIKYGYIQIIIQNSKVVQIDKTEKVRLDAKKSKGGGA